MAQMATALAWYSGGVRVRFTRLLFVVSRWGGRLKSTGAGGLRIVLVADSTLNRQNLAGPCILDTVV